MMVKDGLGFYTSISSNTTNIGIGIHQLIPREDLSSYNLVFAMPAPGELDFKITLKGNELIHFV